MGWSHHWGSTGSPPWNTVEVWKDTSSKNGNRRRRKPVRGGVCLHGSWKFCRWKFVIFLEISTRSWVVQDFFFVIQVWVRVPFHDLFFNQDVIMLVMGHEVINRFISSNDFWLDVLDRIFFPQLWYIHQPSKIWEHVIYDIPWWCQIWVFPKVIGCLGCGRGPILQDYCGRGLGVVLFVGFHMLTAVIFGPLNSQRFRKLLAPVVCAAASRNC